MEFEVKKPIEIPDGNHTGQITKILYRTDPYNYCDVWLSVDDQDGVELKYGCPSTISLSSKLGRLLQAFGQELIAGEGIDPEKVLVGRKCSYMTLKKAKDGKEFSEVVEDSLKPESEAPQVGGTIMA